MALQADVVLVPVDGSDQAELAVEYAHEVAQRYDASLHVLHVLDDPVMQALEAGSIDAADVADEQLSMLDTAETIVEDVSVTHSSAVGFSRTRLSQHPGSAILDVAEELPADFIVVPRSTGDEPMAMLGKAAQYVIEYASQPVLSV